MKAWDHTFATAGENLAADEALLEALDSGVGEEVLRFWEPAGTFVVAGYANPLAAWVEVELCAQLGVSVLRRCSGGGAVVQGPGCLNYALVTRVEEDDLDIPAANARIMQRQCGALRAVLGDGVSVRGVTDLALNGRKFSGNSQRRKRRAILFHGSFLLQADLALIGRLLVKPPRQPDYRGGRRHEEFLMNLNVPAGTIKEALRQAWGARELLRETPLGLIQQLAEKYAAPAWNNKF